MTAERAAPQGHDDGVATKVVAHRTMPRDRPENSIAGIAYTGEVGADVVEVDARRTADGVPVLLHDPLLLRTTGLPAPVRALPAWLVTRLPLRGGKGQRLPTLADALRSLPPGLMMAIDTKDSGAAQAVLDVVHKVDALDRVLLWSQHERAVRHYATNAPDAEIALLRDATTATAVDRMIADAKAWGARAISVHETIGTPEFVTRAHGEGLLVYCWYQSEAAQARGLTPALDGVVSDWPRDALVTLGRA
jgi:glycerophosphoryl diester phosphodiesterase